MTENEPILIPEIVITKRLEVASALYLIAQRGITNNTILLCYVNGKDQTQIADLIIYYLYNSFGWTETERVQELRTLVGKDHAGLPVTYQIHVWKVTIEKAGSIRRD
jgi:hypothetical protein